MVRRSTQRISTNALLAAVVFVALQGALCAQTTKSKVGAASRNAPKTSAAKASATKAAEPLIELNFPEQVDIEVLIDFVGRRLKRNFMYLGSVKGKKITLKSNRKIPLSELEALLASALAMNDLAMVHDGLYIKVMEKSALKAVPFPIHRLKDARELPATENVVQVEIPLKYASASKVKDILSKFGTLEKSGAANIVAIEPSNTLIITDYASNMKRLLHIIELSDVSTDVPELEFVELKNADVKTVNTKLAGIITKMFPPKPGKDKADSTAVTVDFDERRNTLILYGLRANIDALKPIIAEMDKPTDPGLEMVVETYHINNQEVGVVAAALSEILGVAGPSPKSKTGGLGATGGARAATSSDVRSAGRQRADVTIIQNEAANAIYVVASKDRQLQVRELVKVLDRRMPQVLIEVFFVAVSKDSGYDVGVELANKGLTSKEGGAGFTFFGITANDFSKSTRFIAPGAQGAHGFYLDSGNIESIVRMFLTKTDGRVLSHPILLANHNKEAKFESVDEAPYTSVNASDTVATTSFADYEKAGTKLVITPYTTLGENSDFLRLDISIEVSTFTAPAVDPTIPPPKQTNTLEAKAVVVPNNSTIVLGGLDSTNVIDEEKKVPILGDIPLLGFLFKRNYVTTDKTKLYVFMRPRLVQADDFSDLENISEEKQLERKKAEEDSKKEDAEFKKRMYKKSLNLD